MGFVKAFTGALGGSLADQWKDFYMPPEGLPATAAIFAAEAKGTNHGRGANTKEATTSLPREARSSCRRERP